MVKQTAIRAGDLLLIVSGSPALAAGSGGVSVVRAGGDRLTAGTVEGAGEAAG
ncbi:hypothetical protein ACH4B8_05325 [Streptomyces flaveolus]|uniref:hypothetical protein n=1 Tax=Streptomyces flaveolus TaxID=67297 RepID=UPI00379563D2